MLKVTTESGMSEANAMVVSFVGKLDTTEKKCECFGTTKCDQSNDKKVILYFSAVNYLS